MKREGESGKQGVLNNEFASLFDEILEDFSKIKSSSNDRDHNFKKKVQGFFTKIESFKKKLPSFSKKTKKNKSSNYKNTDKEEVLASNVDSLLEIIEKARPSNIETINNELSELSKKVQKGKEYRSISNAKKNSQLRLDGVPNFFDTPSISASEIRAELEKNAKSLQTQNKELDEDSALNIPISSQDISNQAPREPEPDYDIISPIKNNGIDINSLEVKEEPYKKIIELNSQSIEAKMVNPNSFNKLEVELVDFVTDIKEKDIKMKEFTPDIHPETFHIVDNKVQEAALNTNSKTTDGADSENKGDSGDSGNKGDSGDSKNKDDINIENDKMTYQGYKNEETENKFKETIKDTKDPEVIKPEVTLKSNIKNSIVQLNAQKEPNKEVDYRHVLSLIAEARKEGSKNWENLGNEKNKNADATKNAEKSNIKNIVKVASDNTAKIENDATEKTKSSTTKHANNKTEATVKNVIKGVEGNNFASIIKGLTSARSKVIQEDVYKLEEVQVYDNILEPKNDLNQGFADKIKSEENAKNDISKSIGL